MSHAKLIVAALVSYALPGDFLSEKLGVARKFANSADRDKDQSDLDLICTSVHIFRVYCQ